MVNHFRLSLALCGVLVIVAGQVSAAQLDRLFSTSAKRAHLDQLRSGGAPQSDGPVVENDAAVPVIKLDPVTLDGIIRRGDGSEVVWVNGQALEQRDASGGIVIRRGADQHHRVRIETTDTRRYATLKPGQTWDRQNRRVMESHQYQDGGE